jgi:SAM-dependent methyltransferase
MSRVKGRINRLVNRHRILNFLHRPRINRFVPHYLLWKLALPDEVQFWDDFMGTKGLRWPTDLSRRLDPDWPLQDRLREHLHVAPGAPIAILDVAAGPLTFIGKKWDNHSIRIDPVDVLAPYFKELLAEHNITPLIETKYATIEELSNYVPHNEYDLVVCRNALDHAINPMEGIREMLKLVKPGCFVLLHHHRNEAINQRYDQLHQWNFDAVDGRFVIGNGNGVKWDVNKELNGKAEVTSKFMLSDEQFGDIVVAIKRI